MRRFGAQQSPLQDFAHDRASFELTDDDIEALRQKLGLASTGLQPRRIHLHAPTRQEVQQRDEVADWQKLHPNVLRSLDSFFAKLDGKRVAVFLDYDGTLTPIVKNPDEAVMSSEMRATVRSLAELFPVAIVSGRGREKVENFVQLRELYYAGSHGMDIAGPKTDGKEVVGLKCEPAAKFRPMMDTIYSELEQRLADIPGATVEHNTFCVSAHFRNCAVDSWQAVIAAVDGAIHGREGLRVTRGRKVLEVRPQVDWDKGTALTHLLDALGLMSESDVVSLYIGDDRTDEDAFKVLTEGGLGMGILVSSKPKPTSALYTVNDPSQVQAFLDKLVQYGRGPHNGWHTKNTCLHWAPSYKGAATAAAAAAGGATQNGGSSCRAAHAARGTD